MLDHIRVLLVDDAVIVRTLVTRALEDDPLIDEVTTAPNGEIGLRKIESERPDVVVLDVEMPGMNGLETLCAIHVKWPDLPVIMFSHVTRLGASSTLDALSLGASDYVTKPSNQGGPAQTMHLVREQLVPRIRALAGRARRTRRPRPPVRKAQRPLGPVDIVAIGVSTGGPDALIEILRALPSDLDVPILVVQHMPPVFTELFAQRLDNVCAMEVSEAIHGERLFDNRVFLCPGDFHMEVAPGEVRLNRGDPVTGSRPSVDVLFRSAAATFGDGVLGVVLTGMGRDGAEGARAIDEAGGRVIVQDEATSVVWGMPGVIARAGLADKVLPIGEIADEIARRVRAASRPGLQSR